MTVKMDLQTVRLYGSIAIILGCFFFLYPKLMHPLVMTLFGMNSKPRETPTTRPSDLPPHLRDKAQAAEAKSAGMRDDLPDHIRRMRSGPHPGMRAAAAEQSKQTKGSGKGMMGVILPMYAVGIVVYLVYTLFKVFNKKDDKMRDRRSPTRSPTRTNDRYADAREDSEDEGRVSRPANDLVTPQDLQNELQSLVHKVQDKNLTEMDMRKLQERLAETEAQMTKILAAMQAVQGKVDEAATSAQGQGQTVDSKDSTTAKDTSNNQSSEGTQPLHAQDKTQAEVSEESSPGSSESYEIVNQPNQESNKKEEVETVHSKTAEQCQDETQDEEPEDVLLEDTLKKDEDEIVTVRQRLIKKEDSES